MADYRTNDPRGWCGDIRRGAALGRDSYKGKYSDGRLVLREVRLDNGGYDRLGTYWGHGERLYWCASEDGDIDYCFRAVDRAEAKKKVLADYPAAKFYR